MVVLTDLPLHAPPRVSWCSHTCTVTSWSPGLGSDRFRVSGAWVVMMLICDWPKRDRTWNGRTWPYTYSLKPKKVPADPRPWLSDQEMEGRSASPYEQTSDRAFYPDVLGNKMRHRTLITLSIVLSHTTFFKSSGLEYPAPNQRLNPCPFLTI